MSLAGRALLRVRQFFYRAPSTWRINWLRLVEGPRHQKVKIGSRTRFYVRVRSGGRGTLLIGSENVLGFGPGPRLGSGEILLQPRAKSAQVVIGSRNTFSNNVTIV